jgi:hypothetical protein
MKGTNRIIQKIKKVMKIMLHGMEIQLNSYKSLKKDENMRMSQSTNKI